jgi:succinoglycan biosynthesis protein ExoM
MMLQIPHVCICICTYKRPDLLLRLLEKIDRLRTDGAFTYSVSITDNDCDRSAEGTVKSWQQQTATRIRYSVEPQQNIALARNRVVAQAEGDFLAFIDDDEFPTEDWILHMLQTCCKFDVQGVLGPVKPWFRHKPAEWLIKGEFYVRPSHPTGYQMRWQEMRTGNVLLRKSVLDGEEGPFREQFGTGGEDQDFFMRMIAKGHTFIWCEEAFVYEEVPPSRCKVSFMLKRALLRGRNTMMHSKNRASNLAKSCVALPAYAFALPVLLCMGRHYFIRYLIKSCDHAGRLLAALGLNPVKVRSS